MDAVADLNSQDGVHRSMVCLSNCILPNQIPCAWTIDQIAVTGLSQRWDCALRARKGTTTYITHYQTSI